MSSSNCLEVRGVTRRFGSTWVLRGVDATFEAGSVVVLEGSNGAGKSTLLSIIGGLLEPNSGAVLWQPGGTKVGDAREDLGWVGHDASCYRDLTTRENVSLVAGMHGLGDDAVEVSLGRVGAQSLAACRLGTLSRGQKQRVALARAIVHRPKLLLLDEPFTGLDLQGMDNLEGVLREECRRGALLIVVSHDRELAGRLGARRVRLERGRVAHSA